MLKSLKVFAALAAAAGAGLAPAGAQPANSPLSGAGPVMNLISASDVISIMNDLEVTTQTATHPSSGESYIIATSPGGGRFVFRLLGCQNAAQATGCHSALVTAGLPSAGVTYDDLNTFNGNAVVTVAVHVPEQQMLILGRHIIVMGGHSRDLFTLTTALFLNDVESFLRQRAATSSVSFLSRPSPASKIGGLQDRTTAKNPAAIFGLTDISAEVAAAIANTDDVNFSLKTTPAP